MRKYAIHPGPIRSRCDDSIHYITYTRLIELYHLNPDECFEATHENLRGMDSSKIIHIYPKTSGDYPLFRIIKPTTNMKTYNIEWQTPTGNTGWSTLKAESFIEATNSFIAMHPEYRIMAISESGVLV